MGIFVLAFDRMMLVSTYTKPYKPHTTRALDLWRKQAQKGDSDSQKANPLKKTRTSVRHHKGVVDSFWKPAGEG
jgi:hypothetical protein